MRIIIIIVSLIFCFSCKPDTEKNPKAANVSENSPTHNDHDGTHYIKKREFNGSTVENETKTFNIDLQYHKLESPQTYVHHIKSIAYEENDDINICKNFLLSDNGTSFTNIDMIQHADPFYTKTEESIMNKPLLGNVGCGPGLYFENSSDPKFLLTKIKNSGKTQSYIPVSMAIHEGVHDPDYEYELTPTYFQVDDKKLSAIKDSILQGYIHVGTDTTITPIVVGMRTFLILKELKLCKDHQAEVCKSFK